MRDPQPRRRFTELLVFGNSDEVPHLSEFHIRHCGTARPPSVHSASSVSSKLESHEVEASPGSPGRLNKVGGYPVRIKIINPDHSALVGIGSNSGGLESA